MKPLFFFLVFCNIVFYLWAVGVGRPPAKSEVEARAEGGLERIMLVKEMAQASPEYPTVIAPPNRDGTGETSPSPSTEQPTPTAVKEENCLQIGPFASPQQSRWVLDSFARLQVKIKTVRRPTEVQTGYYILYPPASSLEAARSNQRMLQDKGFADAWVIDKGEHRNAVSLGIFNNKEQADEALSRFRARDIEVEIKPRTESAERTWVEIRGTVDESEVAPLVSRPGSAEESPVVKPCR